MGDPLLRDNGEGVEGEARGLDQKDKRRVGPLPPFKYDKKGSREFDSTSILVVLNVANKKKPVDRKVGWDRVQGQATAAPS